jgi:hypothetical protein
MHLDRQAPVPCVAPCECRSDFALCSSLRQVPCKGLTGPESDLFVGLRNSSYLLLPPSAGLC